MKPATLTKKRLWHRCFTLFLKETPLGDCFWNLLSLSFEQLFLSLLHYWVQINTNYQKLLLPDHIFDNSNNFCTNGPSVASLYCTFCAQWKFILYCKCYCSNGQNFKFRSGNFWRTCSCIYLKLQPDSINFVFTKQKHLFLKVIWLINLFWEIYCKDLGTVYPTNIYLFKVNNSNHRKRCEICSKLNITPERRHWRGSGVFIVNFEHISQLFLVFLLLTLYKNISSVTFNKIAT